MDTTERLSLSHSSALHWRKNSLSPDKTPKAQSMEEINTLSSSVHGILQANVLESGLPFPSPGDLPDPGIKPGSPALQADSISLQCIYPNEPNRLARQKIRLLWIHRDYRSISLFLLNLDCYVDTVEVSPLRVNREPFRFSPGFFNPQQNLTMKTLDLTEN